MDDQNAKYKMSTFQTHFRATAPHSVKIRPLNSRTSAKSARKIPHFSMFVTVFTFFHFFSFHLWLIIPTFRVMRGVVGVDFWNSLTVFKDLFQINGQDTITD